MFHSRYPLKLSLRLLIPVLFLLTVSFPAVVYSDYVRVESSLLNIRQGPGTSYPVLFQALAGDEFPLISVEGLWCHITLEDGVEAWAFRRFVSVIPGTIEGSAPPTESVDEESGSSGVIKLLFVLLFFVFAVFVILRRRRISAFISIKMRELSGYRRDEPFRYDEKSPDQDRWEL